MTALDIHALRADTPALAELLHFNNAGCSLTPAPVQRRLLDHLVLEQRIGGYEAAQAAAGQTANFYPAFARLLGCDPQEIAFVENATRAWDLALSALPLREGEQIITGDMEYASNYLQLLHLARRRGLEIITIDSDSQGLIDLDALRGAITPRTRAIALTHVASQRGDVQPAAEVGSLAREFGLWFLLDACQSAGQIPLSVTELGCDFLCGTGRKYLRGPRGTGFLFVGRKRLDELEPEFIDLHAASWESPDEYRLVPDARRFENWERFVAGQIALASAADYAVALGLPAIQARIGGLSANLRDALGRIKGVVLHERSRQSSGIVTFNKHGEDAATLHKRLLAEGINSSVSKQQNARLDLARQGVGDINRASLHYFNTTDEIEHFAAAVARN